MKTNTEMSANPGAIVHQIEPRMAATAPIAIAAANHRQTHVRGVKIDR